MVTLGDSKDLNRDQISVAQIKSLKGLCKKNREKCNQYYGRLKYKKSKLQIN